MSKKVIPQSRAALTTGGTASVSMPRPKLLVPSPTTETSSAPMGRVSMPAVLPCPIPRQPGRSPAKRLGPQPAADRMVPSTIPELGDFERSHLVKTAVRAVGTATLLLILYYVIPIEHRAHESVALRLGVALAFFVAVLINEIRLISIHDRPLLRAAVAMATVIPLFLVLFAWIYLTLSHSDPKAFGGALDRTSALYFTVTIFSTVGFGDIVPKTDPARLVATVQMLSDLAMFAIVIRLILGAATRRTDRQHASVEGSTG